MLCRRSTGGRGRAGGFNHAFYEDALGRPLGASNDPPASPPLTPDQIAAVFTSPEYYQHLASDYYLRILDRPFGPGDDVRAGTPGGSRPPKSWAIRGEYS